MTSGGVGLVDDRGVGKQIPTRARQAAAFALRSRALATTWAWRAVARWLQLPEAMTWVTRLGFFGAALFASQVAVACSQSEESSGAQAETTKAVPDAAAPDLPVPKTEVGFIEVPPQKTAAKYAARMFYAFRAADEAPTKKPLFVMFNGGPGSATSAGLLVFGTGPVTIDPDAPEASPLRDNPDSLTKIANLLYIDERQTGFSYGLGTPPTEACAMSGFDDAADYVRVVLEFLRTHEALTKNPVSIIGESYGGARAILMENLFLFPGSQKAVDTGLKDLLGAHYARTGAVKEGDEVAPDVAVKQFGHMVLIQPLVVGKLQLEHQSEYLATAPSTDIPDRFQYAADVRKPANYDDGVLLPRLLNVLASPEMSERVLGAKLEDVTGMRGDARKGAFRRAPRWLNQGSEEPQHTRSEALFVGRFGALESTADHYYHDLGGACPWTPSSVEPGNQFLQVLPYAKAFITNARYDALIYTPAIPEIMKTYAHIDVTVDNTRGASARPGTISVALSNGSRAEIRFPKYESGHMVTVTAGAAFAADLTEWMAQ